MSEKQWIITAAIVLVIAAALSVYYVPRSAARTLELPDWQPAYIESHMSKSGHDGIYIHKIEEREEVEDFLTSLQTLQMKYADRKHFYEIGKVSADVFVHYDNGRGCSVTLSDNGLVRYNDKNYRCEDTAALKELLTRMQSWEQVAP